MLNTIPIEGMKYIVSKSKDIVRSKNFKEKIAEVQLSPFDEYIKMAEVFGMGYGLAIGDVMRYMHYTEEEIQEVIDYAFKGDTKHESNPNS